MRIRTGIAATAVVVTSLTGAAPAQASTADDALCHEQSILYCACVAVANALSPVIPPESWDCAP